MQVNVRFDEDELGKLGRIMEEKLDPRMESRSHFIRHWVTFGILETFRLHKDDFFLHTYEADLAARQAADRVAVVQRHNDTADRLISTYRNLHNEPGMQRELMEDVVRMYRTTELESIRSKFRAAFPELGG